MRECVHQRGNVSRQKKERKKREKGVHVAPSRYTKTREIHSRRCVNNRLLEKTGSSIGETASKPENKKRKGKEKEYREGKVTALMTLFTTLLPFFLRCLWKR